MNRASLRDDAVGSVEGFRGTVLSRVLLSTPSAPNEEGEGGGRGSSQMRVSGGRGLVASTSARLSRFGGTANGLD